MAEPISTANDSDEVKKPTNAEERKAAAALDALNANDMSQGNGEAQDTKQPNAANRDALQKAMDRLESVAGSAKPVNKKTEEKKDTTKKETDVKKKVKLSSEDIQFLVTELELPKVKATELLRTHEGNVESAVESFITPILSV